MAEVQSLRMYSSASNANSAVQVGQKLLCSESIGWTSALLEVWNHPGIIEEYSTVATPDQVIVLTSAGRYNIESYSRGAWKMAQKSPGMGGATAPMNVSRLRCRSDESSTITTLQMYLPSAFLEEAGEEYRRAGRSFISTPVDFLSMKDSFMYEIVRALTRGVELGAPDLYCNAACRILATHLLLLNGRVKQSDVDRYRGHDLTDRRLSRVLEYMQHHATQVISLDQLAREAGVSRFHFVRLFKRKIGVAPHEYLVELRLRKATILLCTTDLDIATIASQCGYSNAGRFAHAFRKRFLTSPSTYRRQPFSHIS